MSRFLSPYVDQTDCPILPRETLIKSLFDLTLRFNQRFPRMATRQDAEKLAISLPVLVRSSVYGSCAANF